MHIGWWGYTWAVADLRGYESGCLHGSGNIMIIQKRAKMALKRFQDGPETGVRTLCTHTPPPPHWQLARTPANGLLYLALLSQELYAEGWGEEKASLAYTTCLPDIIWLWSCDSKEKSCDTFIKTCFSFFISKGILVHSKKEIDIPSFGFVVACIVVVSDVVRSSKHECKSLLIQVYLNLINAKDSK
jgi:hypothetical protein